MKDFPINRRRFLQATAAVSAIGLAACGTDDDEEPPVSGGTEGEAGAPDSPELTGTLRVADPGYHQPGLERAIDAVTAAFVAANDGVTVEQVAPPFAQYRGAVETQLQAGSPPDVINFQDPQLAAYVDSGWLLPLDDVLAAAGLTVDELNPAQRDAVVGGQAYGVVEQSNPRAYI